MGRHTRAAVFQKGRSVAENDILTYEEVLGLLSQQAREGSVTAAAALERVLRPGPDDDEDMDDELERLCNGD
jgi:hypothetical protein